MDAINCLLRLTQKYISRAVILSSFGISDNMPWFVVASFKLIIASPIVALLVIITDFAGINFAPLFANPETLIFFSADRANIVPPVVTSVGVYQ